MVEFLYQGLSLQQGNPEGDESGSTGMGTVHQEVGKRAQVRDEDSSQTSVPSGQVCTLIDGQQRASANPTIVETSLGSGWAERGL